MENFDFNVIIPTVLTGLLGLAIIGDKVLLAVKFVGKWIKVLKEAVDVLNALVDAIKLKEGETSPVIEKEEWENVAKQIAELKGAIKAHE